MAAEGEGWADDEWVAADHFGYGASFLHGVGGAGLRHIQPNLEHGILEALAVFAFIDGIGVGSDHAHIMLIESARLEQRHGGIERGLAAESGQKGIGLLANDDFFHDFGRDWLDVSAKRELRICHDRGRIRVDQNHIIPFFPKSFAGLHAGIIKFATLSNDDWTGANHQNFFDRSIFRHNRACRV